MATSFSLDTERTIIRLLDEADALSFYSLNLDPDVVRYTGDSAFADVEEARYFLKNYRQFELYRCGRWAVISRSDNEFMGWCGIKYSSELSEYDLGFRFYKKYWNLGLATETSKVVLEYAFEFLPTDIIIGRAAEENTASVKVLEKLGFRFSKKADLHGMHALIFTLHRDDWKRSNQI